MVKLADSVASNERHERRFPQPTLTAAGTLRYLAASCGDIVMRNILGTLAVASMVTFGAIAPVDAQSVVTSVSIADIKASCHAQGSDQACIAAVRAYIADIKAAGLPADQSDALLAQLVVELGSIASSLPADARARVADAIGVIANEISDPDLAARVQVAAANVQAGIDIGSGAVGASPA